MEYLHIIPGKGLSGYFYLDMSISKAIKRLRSFSSKLPNIQIIEELSTKRLIINIIESRLKLIFDELYQTLIILEIDLSESSRPSIPLMFQSTLITDYSTIPCTPSSSLIEISSTTQIHQYKGYSLLLSPNPVKIFIHKGSIFPLDDLQIKVRIYEVTQEKVSIKHITGKNEDIDWDLFPEEVVEILGPPDFVRKDEDGQEFWYVYKHEGVDFVFDAQRNRLVEICLHTNMVDSFEFNEYDRCQFLILLDGRTVNVLDKFEDFREMIGEEVREIMQKRHSCGFKPTSFYQAGKLVFEVLHTGYLSSVSIRN